MRTWILFARVLGSKYEFYVAIMGNLFGILTGISYAWSSPVLEKLTGTDKNPLGNPITNTEYSLVGATFSIGGAIGPTLLIYSLELLGRKYTLLIMIEIIPLFHLLLAFSRTITLYYISRIAIGVAVGSSYNVIPIYLSEIVSSKMKGMYVCLGATLSTIGCVFSYALGPYVSVFYFNLIIVLLSCIYLPIFAISCPETLYYTMQKFGSEKTLVILQKLRNYEGVYEELEEIKKNVDNEESGSLLDLFKSKNGKRAFFICTPLLILQQFSGINIILTYSQKIFEDANVTMSPEVCTIIVGALQIPMSLVAPLAAKKINVKMLLNISFAGVAFSCLLFGIYFYVNYIQNLKWVPLLALSSCMIFTNCGIAALPWVVLGELYPLKVKSVGTAVSCTIYWITQIILTYLFPLIDEGISFLMFAGISLLSIVFVQIFVIETRGKSLQEIQIKMGE